MRRGSVTAYLALVFLLLLSFVTSVMEAASVQMAKNYRRADMNRAIESVFAEFQTELQEEYGIFALDAGYESGRYAENQIPDRLAVYGADHMKQDIRRICFLTDQKGEAYLEQIQAYMDQKTGKAKAEEYLGVSEVWKGQEEKAAEYQGEEQEAGESLERILEGEEAELPGEENPIPHIEGLKQGSLADILMPKDRVVSEKAVRLEDQVSHRQLQTGYGKFPEFQKKEGTLSRILAGEYFLEHFSCAVPEEEGREEVLAGCLDYELEYMLYGNASDRENLEATVKRLILLRFVPNYSYLRTDGGKCAQAEALALTLCSVLAVPGAAEAVKQVLLLAWAFGECVMDLRSLLAGNRVPMMKSEESWQLELSSLMELGTQEDESEGMDTESGLSYKDYLRILLFLGDEEPLALRGLDVVEQNLRFGKGLTWFRADICISRIEIESVCALRRGINYRFRTSYGYQ